MTASAASRPEFHVFLPQMRMTHEQIVERALAAEAAGFEGMAFMDHLAPPLAFEHGMWEAMSMATWVLAKTTTLKVGHLVLCDAFRHPAVLARQATSLDHASGGRFEVGLGWGSVPAELATFGVGSTEPRDRVSRLADSLAVLRALWTGEKVDHAGEYFTLTGAMQQPAPLRPIPLTIGGVGKRTLALVKEYADWWNVPVHALDQIDAKRDQAGAARISMQLMVALISSEAQRAERTALMRRRYAGTKILSTIVIGTAEELADHFHRLHGRGVERFYVWFTDFAPVGTLTAFTEVMSKVPATTFVP